MDEQRLERALRQGPGFATRYVARSPVLGDSLVARRPAGVGRLALLIAVTALLLIGLLAGLAVLASLRDDELGAQNGWVAFAVSGGNASEQLSDRDIYLVRAGQAPHRIVGTDSDNLDQICPAFSPDGRRLAYGRAEGRPPEFDVGEDGEVHTSGAPYHDAALVIVDVDAEGNASTSQTIEVGGSYAPLCATWSPDGKRVAFGVSMTSWNYPQRSSAGSEVWIVTVDDAHVDVVPDVFATDLEWAPDSSELAIASHVAGEWLGGGVISLYSVASGELRTLAGTTGVSSLSWSPDGSRIASQRGSPVYLSNQEIWVTEVDGSAEYLVANGFTTVHGIGPAWSPTGEWIVYQPHQPNCSYPPCHEASDIVLIPADGDFAGRDPGRGQVVLPPLVLPNDAHPRSAFRVIWSPDGKELLYTGWGEGPGGSLIAVPLDASSSPVVLYQGDDENDVSIYDGDALLPTQTWGRRPGD